MDSTYVHAMWRDHETPSNDWCPGPGVLIYSVIFLLQVVFVPVSVGHAYGGFYLCTCYVARPRDVVDKFHIISRQQCEFSVTRLNELTTYRFLTK